MKVVSEDMEQGPGKARHAMSVVAALMFARFQAGAAPVALVSMDNCSHNGEKLKGSVLAIVKAWKDNGLVPAEFEAYMSDEERVSFPWSMIDKITPRPAEVIEKQLTDAGVEDMAPVITSRNTYIAPFVNAEIPQYLVVEDRFPNGRPALEKAGVYLTTRDTVNMTERMKVTTCLNPLHTALAVYGCVLGYDSIASEMKDEELKKLVEHIGYDEGMPVVTDPGIISPMDFIHEVVDQRLPNPFIPDTPQRIATDTSQKVAIRFGETIKSYMASDKLDTKDLTCIPLALAGWLRYLLGVDDRGEEMAVSADPMLSQLQEQLKGVKAGEPDSYKGQLKDILSNPVIFGVNLYDAGLAEKVEAMFCEMLAGPGAVRATLKKYV
jgi:fructuronate reductase